MWVSKVSKGLVSAHRGKQHIHGSHGAIQAQGARRRGKATQEEERGFYNLSSKVRQSNHCLMIHISLNTTKGEVLFKLGVGFGSRTDSHKMIIDTFQLAIKR